MEEILGFNNYHILSGTEDKQTKDLIAQLQKKSKAIHGEILRLTSLHTEVLNSLNQCHVAVAPHKRLPTEVLSRIFVYALPPDGARYPPETTSSSPWVLRWVCSRWRQVALTTRALWEDANLELNDIYNPTEHTDILQLARTVIPIQGPLSLAFRVNKDLPGTGVVDQVNPILDALFLPNMARLVNITLKLPVSGLCHAAQSQLNTFSSTKSLNLMLTGQKARTDDADGLTKFLSLFHSLSTLTLSYQQEIGTQHSNSPPFDLAPALVKANCLTGHLRNLDTYNFDGVSLSMLDIILQRCPNLENIRLSIRATIEDPSSGSNLPTAAGVKFSLPQLRALCFGNRNYQIHPDVMQLDIPWSQLNTLRLDKGQAQFVHPILQQCSNTLRELYYSPSRLQHLYPALQNFETITLPFLTKLELDRVHKDPLVDCLIVPALKDLTVTFSLGQIIPLIQRSQCTLSKFTLSPRNEDTPIVHPLLAQLPSLSSLDIQEVGIDQQVLSAIGSGCLFPHLVDLDCIVEDGLTVTTFLVMLRERVALDKTFSRVTLKKACARFKPKGKEPKGREKVLIREVEELGKREGRDFQMVPLPRS